MASVFESLPLELRLKIYSLLFVTSTVVVTATRSSDDNYPLLPVKSVPLHDSQRSAQLLRVCKSILFEARPILYSKTSFHVIIHAFAGRLPCTMTDGHPSLPYVQHLIWELDCDLMKHLYHDDLRLDPTAFAELKSLELRCRAAAWQNSFIGDPCDREAFIQGRDQTIEYAKILRAVMMTGKKDVDTLLVEDRGQLGRGRVVLRLERTKRRMLQESEVMLA